MHCSSNSTKCCARPCRKARHWFSFRSSRPTRGLCAMSQTQSGTCAIGLPMHGPLLKSVPLTFSAWHNSMQYCVGVFCARCSGALCSRQPEKITNRKSIAKNRKIFPMPKVWGKTLNCFGLGAAVSATCAPAGICFSQASVCRVFCQSSIACCWRFVEPVAKQVFNVVCRARVIL